jgi:hypothetical protein
MNRDPSAADASEHDEVSEVPMQDAWEAQPAKIFDLQSDRPRGELESTGKIDDRGERRSLCGYREPAPQCRNVDALPVVGRDHREAGEPTLGGLGLQQSRQTSAEAQSEPVDGG